jgi:hypothetical protein
MTDKRLFMLNAVIAGGYGIALLTATGPILDLYGITPNPEGVYMARWFGLGLLAIGLTTWLARDAAEDAGGQAIAQASSAPSTPWAGSRSASTCCWDRASPTLSTASRGARQPP